MLLRGSVSVKTISSQLNPRTKDLIKVGLIVALNKLYWVRYGHEMILPVLSKNDPRSAYNPRQEKPNNVVSEPTELRENRRWLEAGNFRFRK